MQALASVQLQAQRDMAEKMIDVCFQRCISAPEERLTDKQRKCLDACSSCFVEGYQLAVSEFYASELTACVPS